MALKTFVKIANISSMSDARYCAGMGVDILGFNIDPSSKDRISENNFKEITDWVVGVEFAGEFHLAKMEEIKAAIRRYPIDVIETSEIDLVEQIGLLGKSIIFKVSIDTSEEFNKLKSTLSYLDELVKIVIIKNSNQALTADLDEHITFYNGNIKLIKGYGVSPSDSIQRFPGLELEATKEEKPGLKDYGEVMDILEVLETD